MVGARFFRDDLPYFVELLAEVATRTSYRSQYMRELRIEDIVLTD